MRRYSRRVVAGLCAGAVVLALLQSGPAVAETPSIPPQTEWAPSDSYVPPVVAGPDGTVDDSTAPVAQTPTEGEGERAPEDSDLARKRAELLAQLDQVAARAADAAHPPVLEVSSDQPAPELRPAEPRTRFA